MRSIKLALRVFSRDWRSGELRILILSLLIAVSGLTAISVVVDRVDRGMTRESGQILGADRVIRSSRPVSESTLLQAEAMGLKRSNSIRFSTMVVAHDAFQLASVRAVDEHYPLAGELRISDKPFVQGSRVRGAPSDGQVWVSPRLLYALNVSLHDQLEIGVKMFHVAGIIDVEPGNADFIEFAPSLIMSLADVAATQVIQPGSRMSYRYDFSGDDNALSKFDAWSNDALGPGERVLGAEENSPTIKSALGRARGYLNLSSLLGLLLGSVAIAMVSNRFIRRHYDHAALLRCIGMKQNHILYLYSLVLLCAALIGSTLGIAAGYLIQEITITLLSDWLPERIPGPNTQAIMLGYMAGILVVAGFSLPGLLRIRRVTPMRILHRDITPLPVGAWLIMISALTSLALIMWYYTLDLSLVLVVMSGGIILTAIFSALAQLLLNGLNKLTRKTAMPVRFGLGHLLRHRESTLSQTAAFGIILTLMLTVTIIRSEFIADWQKQLPPETPNHFIINLPPVKTQEFRSFLLQHSINVNEMYPMVRGRIVKINDRTPAELYGENYENRHNSLRRELNLTWTVNLQKSNQITQGNWQTTNSDGISIEQEMAEALDLKLGDTLTFYIGGLTTTGTITSIRKVEWDSFEPNFYVIFKPGKLENFGATYISSFYLPKGQKVTLNDMLDAFPGISILEIDRILQKVRTILYHASIAVEFVLAFVIAAGLVVLFASVNAAIDEKKYEAGVLRTLGANNKTILLCTVSEYWLLALVVGLIAVISTESITNGLYHFVFKMDLMLHLELWWKDPILAMLLIVPSGLFAMRKIVKAQPLQILNKY